MICKKCQKNKEPSEFWKDRVWCKECEKIDARKSTHSLDRVIKGQIRNSIVTENKLLKLQGKRVCSNSKCNKVFTLISGKETRCKECEAKRFKAYREKNKEKELERQKAYREANREIINQKRREKYKNERG